MGQGLPVPAVGVSTLQEPLGRGSDSRRTFQKGLGRAGLCVHVCFHVCVCMQVHMCVSVCVSVSVTQTRHWNYELCCLGSASNENLCSGSLSLCVHLPVPLSVLLPHGQKEVTMPWGWQLQFYV